MGRPARRKRETILAAAGALLPFLLLAGAVQAAAPGSKSFRDWAAACDNLKGCTALSLPSEAAENIGFLKLERPGGPTGAPTFSLRIRVEKLKAPLSAQLTLDGAPFPAAGKALPVTIIDAESAVIALSPADAEALVAAARKATRLSVSLAGKRYEISLAGSVAAMLWIDEQQGRLNTMTALIRKGATPAANVPAAPALPVVTAKPSSALPALDQKAARALTMGLRRQLKRLDPDLCQDIEGGTADLDKAWPLDDGARLIGLLCSRGAYNLSTGYWIAPGGDLAKARKVAFPQIDGTTYNTLVNADYDPKSGQISFFDKARGIGDCGVSGNYAWTGTGFALAALAEMGECRGLPPDDWLTLYRSEVKLGR